MPDEDDRSGDALQDARDRRGIARQRAQRDLRRDHAIAARRSCSATRLQLDACSHAPWTSTTVGPAAPSLDARSRPAPAARRRSRCRERDGDDAATTALRAYSPRRPAGDRRRRSVVGKVGHAGSLRDVRRHRRARVPGCCGRTRPRRGRASRTAPRRRSAGRRDRDRRGPTSAPRRQRRGEHRAADGSPATCSIAAAVSRTLTTSGRCCRAPWRTARPPGARLLAGAHRPVASSVSAERRRRRRWRRRQGSSWGDPALAARRATGA